MTDFKAGDRVRATLDESVLVGEVSSATWTNNCDFIIELGEHVRYGYTIRPEDGWHIEKVPPPLPTKVGAIVRRADGELFVKVGEQSDTHNGWVQIRSRILWARENDLIADGFEVTFEGVDA